MLEKDQNGVRTSFSLFDLSLDHKNEEDGDELGRVFLGFLLVYVSREWGEEESVVVLSDL